MFGWMKRLLGSREKENVSAEKDSMDTASLPSDGASTVSNVVSISSAGAPRYTLDDLQRIFTLRLAKLIEFAYQSGYEISMGETWRPPETAALYAKDGRGITNSLHTERLAADINLFRKDVLLTSFEDHEPIGIYWESLSTPGAECCWGGRFSSRDMVHFSIGWGGRQ